MSRVQLWICNLILLAALPGCSSLSGRGSNAAIQAPPAKTFANDYDAVWRAMQLAMAKYPMATSKIDDGIYETDYLKGGQAWLPPNRNEPWSNGYRYRLAVRVIRGKTSGKPATKVIIAKSPEIQRDFFSKPEPLPTDGLEEKTLLYRIQRELIIEKAMRKAQEKANAAGAQSSEDSESAE